MRANIIIQNGYYGIYETVSGVIKAVFLKSCFTLRTNTLSLFTCIPPVPTNMLFKKKHSEKPNCSTYKFVRFYSQFVNIKSSKMHNPNPI